MITIDTNEALALLSLAVFSISAAWLVIIGFQIVRDIFMHFDALRMPDKPLPSVFYKWVSVEDLRAICRSYQFVAPIYFGRMLWMHTSSQYTQWDMYLFSMVSFTGYWVFIVSYNSLTNKY